MHAPKDRFNLNFRGATTVQIASGGCGRAQDAEQWLADEMQILLAHMDSLNAEMAQWKKRRTADALVSDFCGLFYSLLICSLSMLKVWFTSFLCCF